MSDKVVAYRPLTGLADEESVVKRPNLTPQGSARGKKSSSLRLSFGPGGASAESTADDSSDVFTPKKSALSRQALERSASQRSLARKVETPTLPLRRRERTDDDRPSYSKEYLDELRSATPSNPRDIKDVFRTTDSEDRTFDVVAKFGVQADLSTNSAIPSEAEIREKKERRARLAREQEYVSLDHDEDIDGDDEGDYEIALRPKKPKWEETRLVREDEDMAEGFDDFVEDGKITLGKKAEQNQKARERAAMREMIEHASGGSSSEDESEAERRAAYEEAQTRAGIYHNDSARRKEQKHPARPTTPPVITPIPTLPECITRLENTLREQEERRMAKVKQLEEIARRKIEVLNRRKEIQTLLDQAAQRYETLREEAGLPGGAAGVAGSGVASGPGSALGSGSLSLAASGANTPSRFPLGDRGLETFGSDAGSSRMAVD